VAGVADRRVRSVMRPERPVLWPLAAGARAFARVTLGGLPGEAGGSAARAAVGAQEQLSGGVSSRAYHGPAAAARRDRGPGDIDSGEIPALGDFDSVTNWVAFTPDQMRCDIELFGGRTGQARYGLDGSHSKMTWILRA
jgi:hypothetical protein